MAVCTLAIALFGVAVAVTPSDSLKNMRTTTYTGRIGMQTFIVETSRERGGKQKYSPHATFEMKGAPILRHKETVSVKSEVRLPCEFLAPSDIEIGPYTRSLIRRSNIVFLGVSRISAKEICVNYNYRHLFWRKKPFSITLRSKAQEEAEEGTSSLGENSLLLPHFVWL